MECYFGRHDDDLIVPKDEEIFDMVPSPDSWPSWVNVGNVNSQKKLDVLGVEEVLSSDPMFYRHTFHQQSICAIDHSDVELNDLPKIEEADDSFLDSLFEADAGELDRSDASYDITRTLEKNGAVPADHSNHIRDSTICVSHLSHFSPEKETESDICMLEERSDLCENTSEYISMNEPVLLELQNLTHQLADATRICLRDSLYRLAENSRYHSKHSQIEKQNLRSQDLKAKESDKKAIDRTVATLLFTSMNFCNFTSAATSTSGFDGDSIRSEYQANSGVYYQGSSTPSPCNAKGGDAEVPKFDLMNQPSRTFFSTTPLKGS